MMGDTAYLLTHKNAPRYRVVAVDLRNPDVESAPTVVPESTRVIRDIAIAEGTLLTLDLDAGIGRMRRVPLFTKARERDWKLLASISRCSAGLLADDLLNNCQVKVK